MTGPRGDDTDDAASSDGRGSGDSDGHGNGPSDDSDGHGDGPSDDSDGHGNDPSDDSGGRASGGRASGDSADAGADDVRSTGTTDREEGGRSTGSGRITVDDGLFRWLLRSEDGTAVAIRDVLVSVGVVLSIGVVLFAVSGVWPPMVAVESGSMEPNMQVGDLIIVVADDRFVGDGAVEGTGVVPLEAARDSGHERFSKPGDVVIFQPDGHGSRTPIIHRAHFWVEEGENWVDGRADPAYVDGASCEELETCPANHDGFVTKGDANSGYDQANSGARTDVVRAEWVTGKSVFRIPWLGHVRLTFERLFFLPVGGSNALQPVGALAVGAVATRAGGGR